MKWTGKFDPLNQLMCVDLFELFDDEAPKDIKPLGSGEVPETTTLFIDRRDPNALRSPIGDFWAGNSNEIAKPAHIHGGLRCSGLRVSQELCLDWTFDRPQRLFPFLLFGLTRSSLGENHDH